MIDEQQLSERVLNWARTEFRVELATDFARVRQFDGARGQEFLKVLLGRSDNDLEILANILPLGVISEDPISYELRNSLSDVERSTLLKLRTEYDRACQKNFGASVRRLGEIRAGKSSPKFRGLARVGKSVIRQFCDAWQWEACGGGRGELGLRSTDKELQVTICIDLNPLEVGYWVALAEREPYKVLRTHDNFLGVLGLAWGTMKLKDVESAPETISKAVTFGKWHADQYLMLSS